jgi:ABC-type multidrug transport system fused ATPase/permease subunit
MVTVVLVGFSSIMAVVLIAADVEVSATMIGLSLTYIISLSGNLQFMVRQSALVENFMTSVERVIDFGVNTPQEREGEGGEGGGEWNDVGELRAENASMRYSPDDPLVLSGVSFSCKQGDNVGICGRTGAGKSSFVNCLLRLTSLEEDGGKIMLGSEDVSKVPLSKLRNAVTLIPQSPVLFDGDVRYALKRTSNPTQPNPTLARNPRRSAAQPERARTGAFSTASLVASIFAARERFSSFFLRPPLTPPLTRPLPYLRSLRYNVDPCGLYSDGDIKKALLAVNLGDALTLDTQVGMDGDNLSVGQQQLLSLARAALRRSKLVVLDEPTANVDQETDVVIRRMMNEGGGGGGGDGGEVAIGDFSKSTVVTIAHRVQSIVDCDVVVVLGAGKVLETGRGRDLAAKKGGIFAGMVDK